MKHHSLRVNLNARYKSLDKNTFTFTSTNRTFSLMLKKLKKEEEERAL